MSIAEMVAHSLMIMCIQTDDIIRLHQLLCKYPGVAKMGDWKSETVLKPLQYCVSTYRRNAGKYMPDMVLMLLQAGAEISCSSALRILSDNIHRYDRTRVWETACHLVDYGAWVSYDSPNRELYARWKDRFDRRFARKTALTVLFSVLRKLGAPRDVARLVVNTRPLRDTLSWKEWKV